MGKFLFIFIITMTLSSCWFTVGYANRIYEYNPEKAGAEILKTINVQEGIFADYTNGLFYIAAHNKVDVFDITNDGAYDKVNIIKSIPFNVETLYADKTDDNYFLSSIEGVFEFDNQIVIRWTVAAQYQKAIQTESDTIKYVAKYKYRNDFINLDYNGNLTFSNLSIDLPNDITHLHYDNLTQYLYANQRLSVNENCNAVLRYKYNQLNESFEKDNDFSCIIHPNVTGVFVNELGFVTYQSNGQIDDCYAIVCIYPNYSNLDFKTLYTNYLNLRDVPVSILFDGNHYWIYYVNFLDSVYKLFEINLL